MSMYYAYKIFKIKFVQFNSNFYRIICPDHTNPNFIPSLWSIMTKVRFEAFLWGAGTALGELPPYFMARAARLSGYDHEDDEDLKEFEELQKKKAKGVKLNLFDRAKLEMERIVEKVGFLGILACASVSMTQINNKTFLLLIVLHF